MISPKNLAPFFMFLAALSAFANSPDDGLRENKKVVEAFYDLAFNRHQPKSAALKYLTEAYRQHNPHVADGRQAFIDAFAGETETESRTRFVRFIAEGDLVVLHSHKTKKPGDRGVAGIDIFRLKDGKINEHWDVNQSIPEVSKNTNSMF